AVLLRLAGEPVGDAGERRPPRQRGERPDVAADGLLALSDDDLVPPGRGDTRVLEPGRPRACDEHALRLGHALERPRAPRCLAPDRRVVDALHSAAADHAA